MHASIQGKHRHGRVSRIFDDRRSSRRVGQSSCVATNSAAAPILFSRLIGPRRHRTLHRRLNHPIFTPAAPLSKD